MLWLLMLLFVCFRSICCCLSSIAIFFAYESSVKKLAMLAPQLKLVLGAHNVPVANPDVLPKLVTAIQTVRAGKVPPHKGDGGKTLYTTDGITFLLKAEAAGVH